MVLARLDVIQSCCVTLDQYEQPLIYILDFVLFSFANGCRCLGRGCVCNRLVALCVSRCWLACVGSWIFIYVFQATMSMLLLPTTKILNGMSI